MQSSTEFPTIPGYYWVRCGGPWVICKVIRRNGHMLYQVFGWHASPPIEDLEHFEFVPTGDGPSRSAACCDEIVGVLESRCDDLKEQLAIKNEQQRLAKIALKVAMKCFSSEA